MPRHKGPLCCRLNKRRRRPEFGTSCHGGGRGRTTGVRRVSAKWAAAAARHVSGGGKKARYTGGREGDGSSGDLLLAFLEKWALEARLWALPEGYEIKGAKWVPQKNPRSNEFKIRTVYFVIAKSTHALVCCEWTLKRGTVGLLLVLTTLSNPQATMPTYKI